MLFDVQSALVDTLSNPATTDFRDSCDSRDLMPYDSRESQESRKSGTEVNPVKKRCIILAMKDIFEYERLNTVSGLVAKHDELSAPRDRYKAGIKKLTVDKDHLDAAIRLFDPNADSYAMVQVFSTCQS